MTTSFVLPCDWSEASSVDAPTLASLAEAIEWDHSPEVAVFGLLALARASQDPGLRARCVERAWARLFDVVDGPNRACGAAWVLELTDSRRHGVILHELVQHSSREFIAQGMGLLWKMLPTATRPPVVLEYAVAAAVGLPTTTGAGDGRGRLDLLLDLCEQAPAGRRVPLWERVWRECRTNRQGDDLFTLLRWATWLGNIQGVGRERLVLARERARRLALEADDRSVVAAVRGLEWLGHDLQVRLSAAAPGATDQGVGGDLFRVAAETRSHEVRVLALQLACRWCAGVADTPDGLMLGLGLLPFLQAEAQKALLARAEVALAAMPIFHLFPSRRAQYMAALQLARSAACGGAETWVGALPLLTFPSAVPVAARILYCRGPGASDLARACAKAVASARFHGGADAVVYALACAAPPSAIPALIATGRLAQPAPRERAVGAASRPEES